MKNKFEIGDKFYYMAFNRICYSIVKNFKKESGAFYYEDNYFDNINEKYMFHNKKQLINFQNVSKKFR